MSLYWLLPLGAGAAWWGMLIALLVCWTAQGEPMYSFLKHPMSLVYISDIAATNLQPIFISLVATQGLCYVLSLAADRYLRHAHRLKPIDTTSERVLTVLVIVLGTIGQLGILMVSIFNVKTHSRVHYAMLTLFIFGLGLSVMCMIAEFILIDRRHPQGIQLRISYIIKTIWFIVSLGLAIAFAAGDSRSEWTASAVCEWALSFLYPFFLITLAVDLAQASSVSRDDTEKNMRSRDSSVNRPSPSYGPTTSIDQPGMTQTSELPAVNHPVPRNNLESAHF